MIQVLILQPKLQEAVAGAVVHAVRGGNHPNLQTVSLLTKNIDVKKIMGITTCIIKMSW